MKHISTLALLSFLALCGCTSVMYIPRVQNHQFYDPAVVHLKPEDITFTDSDGTKLHGWWFAANTKEALGTVIFFHGNGENLTSHFASLSWLPNAGYNYFIFDYPGYGTSEGDPSPLTTLNSGKAAILWVHSNKDPRPLYIYGQSLGGVISYRAVLDLKDQVQFQSLVLDATFLSYRSIARRKSAQSWLLWILQPVAWLVMSDEYAPKDLEKRPPIPLLVMHGQEDVVVPPDQGDIVFEKSAEPKTMWKIPDAHHGDIFWIDNYKYRTQILDYWAKLPKQTSAR